MNTQRFSTPQEFYDFCVSHGACAAGLKEIAGRTIAEWWSNTEHGDYMLWLQGKVWDFTPEQQAENDRVTGAAWAEYNRVTGAAWAEYKRVAGPAWAEYDRVTGAAWAENDRVADAAQAEYKRVTGPAWAEYERAADAARAEYDRVCANAIRQIVGNPFAVE